MIRLVYVVSVIIAIVVSWQLWSYHQAYRFLIPESTARALGAPADSADMTIVAFLDYSTDPTRDINPIVMQALHERPHARMIVHHLPQDNPFARKTALVAVAAGMQGGDYFTVHDTLIRNRRPLTDAVIRELAADLKLDGARLIVDGDSPAAYDILLQSVAAAQRLGVRSTPAFIFNRKTLYATKDRLPTVDEFIALIDNN